MREGQFPVDQQLDVEQIKNTPGVRRMLALVAHQTAFQRGKEQMKNLAGLEVTTKAVERTAEAIGEDIVQREQEEIARALQLDLPEMMGPPIAVLYVEMDGTGVPMVKKETADRPGKTAGQSAHTREAKLGRVFTQTTWDEEGYAIPILIPPLTQAPSNAPRHLVSVSMGKPGNAVGVVPASKSCSATGPNGFGTLPIYISPAPFRSSTSTTLANIFGS